MTPPDPLFLPPMPDLDQGAEGKYTDPDPNPDPNPDPDPDPGQGAEGKYTDPQLHSRLMRYGRADRGAQGIADFFSTHVCNGAPPPKLVVSST